MLCKTVSKRLSEFFDGVLDEEMSVRISQHLTKCASCRKELEAISSLHESLNSLGRIPAPDYLYHLVQTRLAEKKNNTWIRQIAGAFAFRWSRIRTTGSQFYWTRALGTIMAAFFFFVISSSIDPFCPGSVSQADERSVINKEDSKRMRSEISRNLGGVPIRLPERSYRPALHDQYLIDIGESRAGDSEEYDFTVVTEVDSNGAGKIRNVFESPDDRGFLDIVTDTIAIARFRPGYKDGQPVSSRLILKFNKTTVYE